MASAKHSRFTEDVHSTPAPTASRINVRGTHSLLDEMFPPGYYDEFKPGLFVAEEIKTRDLFEAYPPKFKHKNKRFIFNLLNTPHPYSPVQDKSILITRWKPFFAAIENQNLQPTINIEYNSFNYQPDRDTHSAEWYLNFADSNLFSYYAGPLLAQDELQVLECVQLASLREYISTAKGKDIFTPVGLEANTGRKMSTPILISNIERVINLDIREIYGNNFASASEETLSRAFRKQEPPQSVNIIAIEATSRGVGEYTKDQIRFLLNTCYTGFKAAQILALKTFRLNKGDHISQKRGGSATSVANISTFIHTGWWGCGAFGNNRVLILIIQILAAHWSTIDKITFHLQSDKHQDEVKRAQDIVKDLLKLTDVNEVVEQLFAMKFVWEKSNET